MIRRFSERPADEVEARLGGKGHLTIRHALTSPEEFYGKGRLFAQNTLEPGASIGWHTHTGEMEVYYILSGTAKVNDNGKEEILQPGDLSWTGDGESHSIENVGDGPLHFMALILYK